MFFRKTSNLFLFRKILIFGLKSKIVIHVFLSSLIQTKHVYTENEHF